MSEQTFTRRDIIKAILTNPSIDDEQKSALVEELINELKREYPELKYHATKSDIKEVEKKLSQTELKLIKEIEQTRKEIKEIELKLTQEIEQTRKEIKEVDAKLTKEIKEIEARLMKEIKELDLKLSKEIKETKFTMLKWQFVFWISQMAAIIAILYKLFPSH